MSDSRVYRTLTLSDDASIESILTIIPLFCVGIFSIGAFTVLLALKRVDLISIFLFLSSFLGFIAAILDLGQILSRGVANVVNRPGLGDVADFIQAREVLLSFSAGFIFLFFWTFVGLRPIGLPASPRNVTTSSATSTSSGHCGSWTRWGVIGLTLKWLSLLSCILIAILQIAWRVSPQHNRYAELYVTSGILETTISAIFILKIFLNLYLCPATLRRPVMIAHIVPLLALLVNAGLGMGNLVLFSFTETTLGRFLRAIAVYVLIVYLLIATFRASPGIHRHRHASSIEKPPLAVLEKSEKGFDDLNTPGRIRKSSLPSSNFKQPSASNSRTPVRNSVLSKVSSWLSFEPFTSRMQMERSGSSDPEAALSSSQDKLEPSSSSPASGSSLLFRTTPDPGLNRKGNAGATEPPTAPDSLRPGARPVVDKDTPAGDNRFSRESSLSYYAPQAPFKKAVFQDASSVGSNSPVYGLDGITLPPRRQRPAVSSIVILPPTNRSATPDGRENLSPIEQLLQEQSELDRSILALRGLHNRQYSKGTNQVEQAADSESQILTIPTDRDTVASANGASKPSSTSEQSIFSLSVFPEPPAVETPQLASRSTLRHETARGRVGIIPIRIPGVDIPSQPNTPSQFGVTAMFDSAVTQYDVTSFIGDLTLPGGPNEFPTAIATSSFYKSALTLSDDDVSFTPNARSTETEPSDNSVSATSSDFAPVPPTSATSTTPSLGRGLGSATMSSSFKAQRAPLQRLEKPVVIADVVPPAPLEQPPVPPSYPPSQPVVPRAGPIRVQPPSGPRHAKSDSVNRTQNVITDRF